MIDYDYPDLFLGDAVTKDFIITDGEVEVINDDSWAITAEATVAIRNVDLESESFELHQSLNSEMQLRFGSCESAYISFVCHSAWWGDIANLKGKVLNVYIIPNNHATKIIQIGVFKVQENKLTNDRKARKVTAYDAMYDILNSDVADWYNNNVFMPIPMVQPTTTMALFRSLFIGHFGLEAEQTTLVNDSLTIHKTINPETLSGADVIKAICELNGVFGMITNEGKFRFVELVEDIREAAQGVTDLAVSNYIDVEYEDYDSKAITGVYIITNSGSRYRSGSSVTPRNTYTINGNFLISDYKGQDLYALAGRLVAKMVNRYYQPLTVNALGNPVHEVGDAIKVILKDGTELPTYILERNLRGIQALRDTYTARGEEEASESLNSISSRYTQLENNAIQAATEAATVASTTDFVEVIRNIGFRLLDEPSNVSVEYEGGGTYPEWHSGEYYEYAFTGIPFYNGYYEGIFNEAAQKNSVFYSAPNGAVQYLAGIDEPFPDTLFILNGANLVSFRYGYTTGNNQYEVIPANTQSSGTVQVYDRTTNSKAASNIGGQNYGGIITISGDPYTNIDDFIDYIFANRVPFGEASYLKGAYPYIKHVILCDNLTTLENATEYHPGSVGDSEVKIKWTDPADISTNEPCPATWAGTVVVRKEGSAPKHRWDGTLITDSTTKDAYSSSALVDSTVEVDKTYYYGIFPYHVWLDDANNPIKHYRYTKVVKINSETSEQHWASFANLIETSDLSHYKESSSWSYSDLSEWYGTDYNLVLKPMYNSRYLQQADDTYYFAYAYESCDSFYAFVLNRRIKVKGIEMTFKLDSNSGSATQGGMTIFNTINEDKKSLIIKKPFSSGSESADYIVNDNDFHTYTKTWDEAIDVDYVNLQGVTGTIYFKDIKLLVES